MAKMGHHLGRWAWATQEKQPRSLLFKLCGSPGPLQHPLEGGVYVMGESPSEDITPHGAPEELALSHSYEAKLQVHLQPDLSFSFVNNI